MEPIAIVGFAFKLPQEAVDETSLWEVLENRKSLMTAWPEERGAVDSFHDGGSKKLNTMHARGAHFLKEDPAVFDAPFFSITSKEAEAMDPQQRWVLETAYHAFESAGVPVERLRGSRTAVFGASMADDYSRVLARDPDISPRMAATGAEPSCMSNRVSWYFHFRGPSMHINTACSSSLVALDQACQAIRSRDASAALVFGSSMMLTPETSTLLSNMNFLSPDGLCYSFDERANGYSRGEGVTAVFIKPLTDALADGNVIRAVIRATGSNQDGRTPGLTQPSAEAQEMLIRHVYQKAGLAFEDTRYVEAHGTGTPTGDPIEMKAIGRVFRKSRSRQDPLYVGSIKSNVGHLEGGSGLAGLIKTILSLEKGVIPPNALFEKMNPAIDADFYHVRVPAKNAIWPTEGLRRASVNSFGFGGSNAHVILDDAMHYLQNLGLVGHHNCTKSLPATNPSSVAVNGVREPADGASEEKESGASKDPRLLVWTAADAGGLERVLRAYRSYYQDHVSGNIQRLDRLAYTLATRRSHMPWRSFAVVGNSRDGIENVAQPVRATKEKRAIAFVFTGQGAQYAGMGLELMRYPTFADTLRRIDSVLTSLGCTWSLFHVLGDQGLIDSPEYSQPLCTALQLALVELLKTFAVKPVAVVGHSSGEIAAAYTSGALSLESASLIAYYRGKMAEKLRAAASSDPGAMMSVNLPEAQVRDYVGSTPSVPPDSVHVACVNSPNNCTLSGSGYSIDKVKQRLDADGVFAQILKTGVAYHSPAMHSIAAEYLELLGTLNAGVVESGAGITMISSVTGCVVAEAKLLSNPQYWADNLVSPVRFADAVQRLAEKKALRVGVEEITDIVEVGPHSALRRPVLDTLATMATRMRYIAAVQRAKSPLTTLLTLLGTLFCHGHPVSISLGNGHGDGAEAGKSPLPLVDCPQYPFDHSRRYWTESRLSRSYRLRPCITGHLLGKPAHDWNELRPRFRNWLSVESIPWLGDHVVSDAAICPGAGMIVMAIEAVVHFESSTAARPPISGFFVKEARFLNPIPVPEEARASTETCLYLRPLRQAHEKESGWFEIVIFAFHNNHWSECFQAQIQLQHEEKGGETQLDGGRERELGAGRILSLHTEAIAACSTPIDSRSFYTFLRGRGLTYGPAFRQLQDMRWNGRDISTARIDAPSSLSQAATSPVHPAVLDAAVHIIMTQVSKGLAGPTPTLVPQRISNAWISAQPWGRLGVSARLISSPKGTRSHGVEASLHAVSNDGLPLCSFERIFMVPVSKDYNAPGEEVIGDTRTKLLYGVEWKPQLSTLSPEQLLHLCGSQSPRCAHNDTASMEKLNSALQKAARHAVKAFPHFESLGPLDHFSQFLSMLEQYYSVEEEGGGTESWQKIEALLKQCEVATPSYRIFTNIGLNLVPILRGHTDPLELLYASGVDEFYASVFDDVCDARFQSFLDLATHQNPGMRIIEVGAGTGAMTSLILGALQAFERRRGTACFAEYTYTDISPSFFEDARVRFSQLSERVVFKKLDLERDPGEDGFELGAYDMVVAGSVLHATSRLSSTLAHVRSLLRPGGRLVNVEITAPQSPWANVVFGTVPGWWKATEEWRKHGPLVTEDMWETLVRGAGFSGFDLCLRTDAVGMSLMVSTAMDRTEDRGSEQSSLCQRGLVIIVDPENETQKALSAHIAKDRNNVRVVPLDHARETKWAKTDVVVVILEVGAPKLSNLRQDDFQFLQALLQRTQNLLWATAPSIEDSSTETGPQYGLAAGLLRVLRSEEPTKHFVTLDIEHPCMSSLGPEKTTMATERTPDMYADHILRVIRSCYDASTPSPELEFVVRNGFLTIGRMVHAVDTDQQRIERVQPRMQDGPWLPGLPLKLDVGTPGTLDTLRFIEDVRSTEQDTRPLSPGEVEIEAKTWAVSLRDVFISLGRLGQEELGFECAGIVSRVGGGTSFQVGDRVCMVIPGCMRTYPRAPADAVFKLFDSVSFHDAVAALNPGMTAYHALVNIASLKRGEKILIHSASGSTGQMAVAIARRTGAEIFATVGFPEKKQLLMNKFGIAADHIFYSRNTSFAQGVMRVTNGYGVDVVLNSLSGDGLRASWECIAPYGRFIEIGKMDIGANASLPMASFAQNVSFCAIDLHHIAQTNKLLTRQLVESVMDMVAGDRATCPSPLHVYPLTEVEKAFRYMQSGRNTGRTIIDVDRDHIVPKLTVEKTNWRFDPDASYVVAGGLGGLGRAILQWMANKGARYLIVPSRSGVAAQVSRDIISDLQSQGVHVVAPRCDTASATELATLLRDYTEAHMPPIKGCINAAMALHDAVFEGMAHAQWEQTIKSKVDSSWNLHQQLPPNMDFFILLSSLAGVYGSISQANYAAGCTFQDALARHRTALGRGKTSVSLDLGWMVDAGIITERVDYARNRSNVRDMKPVKVADLTAVLDIYCDPSLPQPSHEERGDKTQLLIGAVTPVDILESGGPHASFEALPLLSGFAVAAGTASTRQATKAQQQQQQHRDDDEQPARMFQQAVGDEARAGIVVGALVDRVARALDVAAVDVDSQRPLSGYGVDSLMAVELRNWIRRDFRAAVAVFEIMDSGMSIVAVGGLVVERTEVKENTLTEE